MILHVFPSRMRALLLLLATLPGIAHASDLDGAPGFSAMQGFICGALPLCGSTPIGLANRIIAFLYPLIGIVAVLGVIYAGIRLSMHQGDDAALGKAKDIVVRSAVGAVLGLMALQILKYVAEVLVPLVFG